MKNPFELILWAIAIGFAWLMLTSMTGLDDFLKKFVGRKDKTIALEEKIKALEKRLVQLEEKNSAELSQK